MFSSKHCHLNFSAPKVLRLIAAFAALATSLACKPGPSEPAPAGSSSSAAMGSAGSAPKTPCGKYAALVCEKAGEESPTCHAFKINVDLMSPAVCEAGLKDIDYTVKQIAKMQTSCDKLIKQLCAAVGPKTKTCEMVTKQTKQFPPERCQLMLEKQDEIIADLKQAEENNKPLSAKLQKAISDPSAPAFGPANASVQIVEFSDFQCPFCAKASKTVHQIKEKYGNKVRFVFRQFPLPNHAHARDAAAASLAAHAQGKFWEYHDLLFENPEQLDQQSLEQHASALGLDLQKFRDSMADAAVLSKVDADLKLGRDVRVNGTPTLFINGERIQDPGNFEVVSKKIDEILKG